jgi:hypothetical protein
MKYIDAGKLKAEIEERIALLKGVNNKGDYAKGSIDADMGILEYIDSLQQEQSGIDLVKEVKKYIKKNFTITDAVAAIPEKDRMYSVGSDDLLYLACYFIQLGLNARME